MDPSDVDKPAAGEDRPSSASAPKRRLRVVGLSGDTLLDIEAEETWTVGFIKQKVAFEERILCKPWQLKLQLAERPLQDGEILKDLEAEELTAVVVKESVAGIYAAFTCRESAGPMQNCYIAGGEEATGDWTVEGITLKLHAQEDYLGDDLMLEAQIASSADALQEGISETILVAKIWHKFRECERSLEPEDKTFYKIHQWP
ncbi:Uncharacterized protein SCF082_LOCUS51550 [Durusdinium trenchii]|uniref:Ubiquitin-like domain-containing protein n=1 Tax=Durusdinium trenchii TaxID=1381693 RepID=A0ABP0SF37_9DINO